MADLILFNIAVQGFMVCCAKLRDFFLEVREAKILELLCLKYTRTEVVVQGFQEL